MKSSDPAGVSCQRRSYINTMEILRRIRVMCVLVAVLPILPMASCAQSSPQSLDFTVEVSPVVHAGTPFFVVLKLPTSSALKKGRIDAQAYLIDETGEETLLAKEKLSVTRGGEFISEHVLDSLQIGSAGRSTIRFTVDGRTQDVIVTSAPGWSTLLPPLVTLAISIWYQQVIVALLVGIWAGALLVSGFNPVRALLMTFDTYLVGAFTGEGNAAVLLFTFLLGGTIGLVQRSGGALGLANALKGFMGTRSRGQACTVALGCLIFFDDYSSILIVGNSLRDVVRAVGVSPAKFAWLVHSMGVVLASLSPISSWVGLQIGYTKAVLDALGISPPLDGFLVVLRSLPFRFFPLFYLVLILFVLVSGRDFGPMADSESSGEAIDSGTDSTGEREAGTPKGGGGGIVPKAGTPLRSSNALVPFAAVIVVTFGGMMVDGISKIERGGNQASLILTQRVPKTLVNVLSSCDSVAVLIWASAAGWFTSVIMVCSQGILSLPEAMEMWMEGMKEVLEPQFVLLLAWALGHVVKDVQTAEYLAGVLGTGIPPYMLPTLISVLCYLISYACGSTFGTMGIVFPLVGPLAWRLGGEDVDFLHHCFACILGASLFGSVCSPISDTTILTSLATGCGLGEHVRTTTPYTFAVATISILVGSLPVGIGFYGPWVALGLGTGAMVAMTYGLGRAPPRAADSTKTD
ncbi:unnamed protein product [Ascophyllum nodosum]